MYRSLAGLRTGFRKFMVGYLLAHGGARLAQALAREGLVDEYRLVIHPAALGDGLALFKDLPGRLALELIEAHTYSTGAAIHVYRPRRG